MKTKSISKTMPTKSMASFTIASIKKTFLLLVVLFALIPSITKAQVVRLEVHGMGMAVCASYSYNVNNSTTLSVANYGGQYYACTGTTQEDIAFTPSPVGYRVQSLAWAITANTTCTACTLYSVTSGGAPITPVTLNANDMLMPVSYTLGTPSLVQLSLNGTNLPGIYDRDLWYIDTN